MHKLINVTQLVGMCEAIQGRKKLQKIVHLLQESGYRSEFPQEFGYLHYGPYSAELRADIDQLTSDDWEFLEETPCEVGNYPTSKYSMTDCARECFQEASITVEPLWKSLAIALNDKSPQELEAISTVVYLQQCGYEGEALKTRFDSLKPSLVRKFDCAQHNAASLLSSGRLA